jgi:hypothetical protein
MAVALNMLAREVLYLCGIVADEQQIFQAGATLAL